MKSAIDYRKRIQQIYNPPESKKYWKLDDIIGHNNIRYFSFGRHALAEALVCAGIGPGDKVLLPGLICRSLLSAINSIGAVPVYYPVGKELQLSVQADELPEAKAIIAVNYFGFPQDLGPFHEYCRHTGAVLIEDNAQGLFSKDQNGQFLGTRGDIGIFSLRKSAFMPDGAAFVINFPSPKYKLKPQIPFSGGKSLSFSTKQIVKKLTPWIGVAGIQFAISLTRYFRRVRTGHEIIPSTPESEYILPGNASPCVGLLSYLASVDITEEKIRRRELYVWIDDLLRNSRIEPVFKSLLDNVVPYVYPFYTSNEEIDQIRKILNRYWLNCFQWPELPEAILPVAPVHYKSIWGVWFLW